jgi:hypothetical protein
MKTILESGGITPVQKSNREWKIQLPAEIFTNISPICADLNKTEEEIMQVEGLVPSSSPNPRAKKKQRQEGFKEMLNTTLRNFLNQHNLDLSIQEKIYQLLEWGREYAKEVDLIEDFIARSMKGNITPIPEFTQAIEEEIKNNIHKLLDKNLYSPNRSKQKKETIESKLSIQE